MEQASEIEAGQGGARPLLHHGHSAFTIFSPPCHRLFFLPFISLATQVISETQQPQRHINGKSSTLISNFAHSRTPGNKGRGLSILSLLTIAILKFQLWNLFCATAWNRKVGAVPKFAQW